MKNKKIGLVSLGCPKNLVDSEEMVGRLTQAGYEFTGIEEEADLVLINTCGFIETAKEESIDIILSFTRKRTRGELKGLVVTGCLAQRYGDELSQEIPEVDRFLLLRDEKNIVKVLDEILEVSNGDAQEEMRTPHPRSILTPFHTAYLKISEGCSNRCSYCTIPLIRGPHRSKEIPGLLDEAEELCRQGVREVILIGQDIARFGNDRGNPEDLVRLLRALSQIEGLFWIRLMYLHPGHLSEDLIQTIASEPRILPYLDLPVQHINDTILSNMNRNGDARAIRDQIRVIRERIPGLVLRTSLIVGFPGETEEIFQELCDFVEETRFDHLGVFAYSREQGTPAAALPDQVDESIKAERKDTILGLQAKISREKNLERVGTVLTGLVEGTSPETDLLLAGRYYGQAPEIDGLVLINEGNAEAGKFYDVRITDAHTYDLVGKIVE
jgi:ribosomal protein S12 methylthiotransferase